MKKILRENKGIAVIFIVGVIAILVVIAVALAFNTMMEQRTASTSADIARAEYLAEAGLEYAIARIAGDASTEFVDDKGDVWYSASSFDIVFSDNALLDNTGRYQTAVLDCQRMVNANNANSDLLEELLGNLGLPTSLAANIISARPFETKFSLRKVSGIGESRFNTMRDYVTVNSWSDEAAGGRSPININTAEEEVIKAVLSGGGLGSSAIDTAYTAIDNWITTNGPLSNWTDFNSCIDATALSAAEKDIIKANCNPNLEKPPGNTTEFCFNSCGYYEIYSTGTNYRTDTQAQTAAERKIFTVVRVYGVFNLTNKDQFRGEDDNYNDILDGGEDKNANGTLDAPTYERVNWLDSCPVNSDDDEGLTYASDYETVDNAIKLGFWDNFDEDNDNINEEGWSWRHWHNLNGASWPTNISDGDSDGDNEIWGTSVGGCWAQFALKETEGWSIDDEFSVRVNANNLFTTDGRDDAGSVEFFKWGSSKVKFWVSPWGFLTNHGARTDITREGLTVAVDPDTTAHEGKDYFNAKVSLHLWDGKSIDRFSATGWRLYNIPVCDHDHYNDWQADQNADQYHGVTPAEATFKLVVTDNQSPNYRTYIAPGLGIHRFYNYSNGWFISSQSYNPITNDYINVPLHNVTEPHYDRYGYWSAANTGVNSWNTVDAYIVLAQNKVSCKWDEVRVIYPDGFYQSDWYDVSDTGYSQVEWGTISWNTTLPETADAASEQVSAEVDTGSGFTSISNRGSIGVTSSQCRFKINLTTQDDDYSETPVVDDITLTYLIPVETEYFTFIE